MGEKNRMRTNCPVCGNESIDKFQMKYAVPDGWELPELYTWRLCKCGFIWADNEATQETYNAYYRNHYIQNMDMHDYRRLDNLSYAIFSMFSKELKVIDYGGGNEYLVHKLRKYGFNQVSVCNVDDKLESCDLIIASQVVEHIYDLDGMMKNFIDNLKDGGFIIVETPDALNYSKREFPPLLDYYPTHINHFSATQLNYLFARYGFSNNFLMGGIEYKPTNAPMFRTVYVKNGNQIAFNKIKEKISNVKSLDIKEPVIVYGLGDLTLYQIANSNLNIVSFVDESSAYKGATINNIPVLDHVEGDYPVIVFGKRSQESILSKLEGRKNKVILYDQMV